MTINEPSRNLEIEQQILGALIKDITHSNSRETLDSLSADDFYSMSHRLIYSQIKRMTEQSEHVDLAVLDERLAKESDQYGGFIYLAELNKNTIGVYNLPAYVGIIKKCAQLRTLQKIFIDASEMINQGISPDEITEIVDNSLKDASVSSSGAELTHITSVEGDWLDRLQKREESGGGITGLKTGIDALDERINGIGDQSLVVVAGAPSMGKTLLCQTMAANVGVDQKKNIMFFSMEMSGIELFERFVSGIGNIPPTNLRSARLGPDGLGKAEMALSELRKSGIYITDQPKQSVGQIRAKVRRHKNQHPNLSAIFIDYLGLMKLGKADRHDIAVGNITRDLKELAKEVKVPIILCAQANRYKSPARPTMANLKDSSCIEADADLILFVHREEILDPSTDLKGVTELIVAKDRHNDGNGTIHLEKINGSFNALSNEQVGRIQMNSEQTEKPPYQRGMDK